MKARIIHSEFKPHGRTKGSINRRALTEPVKEIIPCSGRLKTEMIGEGADGHQRRCLCSKAAKM